MGSIDGDEVRRGEGGLDESMGIAFGVFAFASGLPRFSSKGAEAKEWDLLWDVRDFLIVVPSPPFVSRVEWLAELWGFGVLGFEPFEVFGACAASGAMTGGATL